MKSFYNIFIICHKVEVLIKQHQGLIQDLSNSMLGIPLSNSLIFMLPQNKYHIVI